jgi:hypothetical protein
LEVVSGKLTAEDDRDPWQIAPAILSDEFMHRYDREAKNQD